MINRSNKPPKLKPPIEDPDPLLESDDPEDDEEEDE